MTPEAKKFLASHRKSLYLLFVYLAVLVGMFFLTIAKDIRIRRQLEQQLSETSLLAERNKMIAPLLMELQKKENLGGLENNDIQPLFSSETGDYQQIIEQILRQYNLEAIALAPNIESILSDTGTILVDLTTRGAFSDFRGLILQLGRLSFLSGIERFYIQQAPETAGLEMFLQLRIQVGSTLDGMQINE